VTRYPATRTVDAWETSAGEPPIADPYRWLEEETDEVRLWQKEQNALATEVLGDGPDQVIELVDSLMVERAPRLPRLGGGRWFRVDGGTRVVVSNEPYGQGEVVAQISSDHFLSWISPSPDGSVLGLGVCTDGSEQNTIRLVTVSTRAELPAPVQVLYDGWVGGAVWEPDSSAFWFLALTGSVFANAKGLFLHRLGESPPTAPEPVPAPADGTDYTIPQAGERWVVAAHGLMTPKPYAVLDRSTGVWRPFMTELEATVAGQIVGDRYVAVTDVEAPRGRLVAIDLASTTPDDPSTWTELVPESDAVLRTVWVVGERIFLNEYVDTYARVREARLDGTIVRELTLPTKGTVGSLSFPGMNLPPRGQGDELFIAFSSPTTSWQVLRERDGELDQVVAPAITLPDTTVLDLWVTSADGTKVPYHVISPAGLEGPAPTLIYAYGGFNAPFLPQFPPKGMLAFVAAGGRLVLAHLRGGAELGRDWWHGGRKQTKHRCYEDLYAVAEGLVSDGRTTAPQLAICGGSNGGLLAGVAVTQRPGLWGAVIPMVPFLDVVGGLREPYGHSAITLDLGDPDDPDDVRRMAGLSPYHLVVPGTAYPATFIEAGDSDPRCPPWHARKLGARMQAAQGGDAPVLVRIWENVGHGWATPRVTALREAAEWLAFAMHHTGLRVRSQQATAQEA
jgi:prolyl oligopeptidase